MARVLKIIVGLAAFGVPVYLLLQGEIIYAVLASVVLLPLAAFIIDPEGTRQDWRKRGEKARQKEEHHATRKEQKREEKARKVQEKRSAREEERREKERLAVLEEERREKERLAALEKERRERERLAAEAQAASRAAGAAPASRRKSGVSPAAAAGLALGTAYLLHERREAEAAREERDRLLQEHVYDEPSFDFDDYASNDDSFDDFGGDDFDDFDM